MLSSITNLIVVQSTIALQKNHGKLLLTFVPNLSFAHIQADGLHKNNDVVSRMSFLVVYLFVYLISKIWHWIGMSEWYCNGCNIPRHFENLQPCFPFLSSFSFAHLLHNTETNMFSLWWSLLLLHHTWGRIALSWMNCQGCDCQGCLWLSGMGLSGMGLQGFGIT